MPTAQTPLSRFTEFATERMRRSGVIVDDTYHFTLDTEYTTKDHLIIKPQNERFRYYVHGDEHTFWVFERANLWPTATNGQVKPLTLPVQFRKSKPTPRGGFYVVDNEIVANDSYTPIPEGMYTAHECDIWLAEHASTPV